MKKFFVLALMGVLTTILTVMPDAAFAADATQAGKDILGDFSELMRGNIGTMVGLGIAVFGLYMWLVQQASWGIVMIIGGVAITAFPGLFESMQDVFASSVTDSSDDAAASIR